MPFIQSLSLAWKAWRQLGAGEVSLYGLYRLGLITGWWRWRTSPRSLMEGEAPGEIHPLLALPEVSVLEHILGSGGLERLQQEAEEIVSGQVRLFGGPPVELELYSPGGLPHWTRYQQPQSSESIDPQDDIRWIWEYGRFGWALCLARAYHLFQDERYSRAFWEHCERFMENNPPNRGVHWVSAQEVALRCIALVFAWQVFKDSPYSNPERNAWLARAIAWHAERIPPTLIYARAQANNHLLSEAAGLYTAGLALPGYPQAGRWRELGWEAFNRGLVAQITPAGEYCQHSSNYQRLMLQLALWVGYLAAGQGDELPVASQEKLRVATLWFSALCEPACGWAPNLGANDGSNFLPLSGSPVEDYRPVLQAASLAFVHRPAFLEGAWDEEACWLGMGVPPFVGVVGEQPGQLGELQNSAPVILRLPEVDSWAYLRCSHYDSRPSHADQLHLDLWWQGVNIAQDAGSYLYNAAPPWDNALRSTEAHNTLAINGSDQMRPAGRFLWLDWAQARLIEQTQAEDGVWERLVASHNGYRGFGVEHRRTLTAFREGRWEVLDQVLPIERQNVEPLEATLHWLLPDWEWQVTGQTPGKIEMQVQSPQGRIGLSFQSNPLSKDGPETLLHLQVVRTGKMIYGEGSVKPVLGWVSRRYGYKEAALSVRVSLIGKPPLEILSEWICTSY